jgi:hypothetical protein
MEQEKEMLRRKPSHCSRGVGSWLRAFATGLVVFGGLCAAGASAHAQYGGITPNAPYDQSRRVARRTARRTTRRQTEMQQPSVQQPSAPAPQPNAPQQAAPPSQPQPVPAPQQ